MPQQHCAKAAIVATIVLAAQSSSGAPEAAETEALAAVTDICTEIELLEQISAEIKQRTEHYDATHNQLIADYKLLNLAAEKYYGAHQHNSYAILAAAATDLLDTYKNSNAATLTLYRATLDTIDSRAAQMKLFQRLKPTNRTTATAAEPGTDQTFFLNNGWSTVAKCTATFSAEDAPARKCNTADTKTTISKIRGVLDKLENIKLTPAAELKAPDLKAEAQAVGTSASNFQVGGGGKFCQTTGTDKVSATSNGLALRSIKLATALKEPQDTAIKQAANSGQCTKGAPDETQLVTTEREVAEALCKIQERSYDRQRR
uniref:Variant surface glycoprotein 1125.1497 n=1 Tax=Trypanosoma brucei TaxID=5691 RepID=A0A1J0R7F2_9TRYP|nr:variant surface glycoprotein 1125.1497 [Trypanosoma brucei]